jgi:hypothetical protein
MKIDFTEIFCHVDDFFRELDAKTNFITDKLGHLRWQLEKKVESIAYG